MRRLHTRQLKTIMERKASYDPEDILVIKDVPAEIEADGPADSRQLHFVVSTGAVDRDGDVISPDGWRLERFAESGVVLWAHDVSRPPLAKPIKTWVENDRLHSIAEYLAPDFADHDHVKFADMIFRMVRGGFLKGVSVGFKPLRHSENAERGGWMPIDYLEQELLEWSNVPIPANSEALYQARTAGIDIEPLGEWVQRTLEAGSPGLWVPKRELEALHKDLHTAGEIVTDKPAAEPAPECPTCDFTEADECQVADDGTVEKPYPNEHACRLRSPRDFEPDSFRRMSRKHDGKTYHVIVGRLKGETSTTEQAYRYPKDTWYVADARAHCRDKGGHFEAAAERAVDVVLTCDSTALDAALDGALDKARELEGLVQSSMRAMEIVKSWHDGAPEPTSEPAPTPVSQPEPSKIKITESRILLDADELRRQLTEMINDKLGRSQ